MNKQLPSSGRFAMFLVPVVLAGGLWVHHETRAAEPANNVGQEIVYEYADQVTRLVQSQKIDELSKLNIPSTTHETSKLEAWKEAYVAQIQKQEGERQKEYNKAVTKAQEELKKEKFDEAMLSVVMAYQIAKDQNEFLKLDWVKDLTAKVAARAADYEKKGDWIESLQLYTDLNSLYEIDTRYKADMQRLARRTRLLAVYTPQAFYETRKALIEKQDKERAEELQAEGTTQPADSAATKPSADEDLTPSFTRWQDYVEQIQPDMGLDAIRRARNDWVELTAYDTLVKGGVDALRLFLTTPELAKEFPGLADPAARDLFNKALDGALARDASGKELTGNDVDSILNQLVNASDSSVKLPKEVIVMEFTDGAMEKLDPFSAVIWPHERPEFDKTMRGTFGGVGVMIGLESGKLQVISPLEDTPAFRAGIQAGDIITAIDGQSAINISIDQAVHKIMGKPDTQVTLRIKRGAEAPREYTLTRAIINVHSVKGFERLDSDQSKWNFMLDPDSKVGYIRITGFQDDTAEELHAALDQLKDQGMRGLILDLRFNPGGLLRAAVDISNMFLDDGVIVSTRGRSAEAREYKWTAHKENTIVPTSMPIIVLVNQYSASASEIFSGAMKDLHRGYIIGHRSFGKGSVQNLIGIGSETLSDGTPVAEMKLTMAYYYLPLGENLHRRDGAKNWGVDPDVTVDLTPDQLNDLLKQRRDSDVIHSAAATEPATTQTASSDTQLDTALLMLRLQLVQSHPQ